MTLSVFFGTSAMATYQQQHPQTAPHPPPSNWDQRNSGFVPPTRMAHPPNKDLHSSTPPAQRPQSTSTRSSFFSFGRHKSSQSVGHGSATEHGQTSRGPSDAQAQLQQQQSPPPQQQQPPQAPASEQQQPQQPPQPERRMSAGAQQPAQAPPLHPELRSFVSLAFAHVHKIYFSGPLVRKIERSPDGNKPSRTDEWVDVWAQLGGTTLSIWEMKEIEQANKEGREVPPSYINVTDAVRIHSSSSRSLSHKLTTCAIPE
jgi:CCR4-NOT transcriptional complex subunit CAF120